MQLQSLNVKKLKMEQSNNLIYLHKFCTDNKSLILSQEQAACFHCKQFIKSEDISEYWDQGKTAVCPKCGVDALIPKIIDSIQISKSTLESMCKFYFDE